MAHLYYLVGPPGSGKRTVGKVLSRLSGAALMDNHLINDPIFTAFGADGQRPLPPAVWALVRQVREAVLNAVEQAPPHLSHIFTNDLADQPGEELTLNRLRALASKRGSTFIPVWLECPLPELERRMPCPDARNGANSGPRRPCGSCWTVPVACRRHRTPFVWPPRRSLPPTRPC